MLRTTSSLLVLPHFTSDAHSLIYSFPLLICPSVSFGTTRTLSLLFPFLLTIKLHRSHSYISPSFPAPSAPSPFFSLLPNLLHTHLLPKTDNIPDGVPLLATHRQINQSNNIPINSNYALISPGRSLLGVGKDVAFVE